MSFIHLQKKIKKNKMEFVRIRIRYPGSVSADPDLHQNEADPKHCLLHTLSYMMPSTYVLLVYMMPSTYVLLVYMTPSTYVLLVYMMPSTCL